MCAEKYKRTDGEKGIGYRMVNIQGYQLRINFQGLKTAVSEEFSRDAMYIKGIDYWDSTNTNWERATLNVTFSRDCNILQIYKNLLALIKAGKKGQFTLADLNKELNEAAPTSADRSAFLKSKGLKASMAYKGKKNFEQYAAEHGVLDEWFALIQTGAPEVNSTSEGLKAADATFTETKFSDPEHVFDDIEEMTGYVAKSDVSRSLIICGMGGIGKCLPLWGRIPTPSGWTTMGEINVGDEVIAKDGTAVKVLEKYEQTGHTIYRLHLNDGQHIDVDDEQILHVELMDHSGSKGLFNITLAELRQYLAEHPNCYATIPYCSPVSCFTPQELKVDPYFLGLLLGDGCITTSTPMLSNVDPDIITGVHKLVLEQYENIDMNFDDRCTYRLTYHGEGKCNPLTQQLKDLGVHGRDSYTKFIPFEYKRGSIEQRMELVRGLMDSDGYVSKNGCTSFSTCSKQLADDFAEVIRSLGGRAVIKEKHTKSQLGTPCLSYDISFKLMSELGSVAKYSKVKTERYEKITSKPVWFKKRRIKSVECLGTNDTACILIDHPDHLYLMEDYVPVHNTYHVKDVALPRFGRRGVDWVYHGAMNATPNSFFQTVFGERDKVICFDEADAILGNSDIVVMLKPLLDTGGDHRCEWSVQTVPMGVRSDEEILGYCANLSRAIRDGEVETTWSRTAGDMEQLPEAYDDKQYDSLIAQLGASNDDGSETELSEPVRNILELPMKFETELTKALTDENGDFKYTPKRAAKIVRKIVDRYEEFLSRPEAAPKRASANANALPTARYPSIFFFTGKMIFISNMPGSKLDQAVMSRSIFIDVQLRAEDVLNRIMSIVSHNSEYDDVREPLMAHLKKMIPSTGASNQTEAATYSNPQLRKNGKQLTLRYVKIVADMIRHNTKNWEGLAARCC